MSVDSYRFVDLATRQLMRAWAGREPRREPVWTPLAKPLSESRLAMVSSAAVALEDDEPFDADGERRDPWWGDPSYRRIPAGARAADIKVWHLHIDVRPAEQDLDCVLPLARAADLAAGGVLGSVADTHYSFMGYLLRPETFLETSVPEMIAGMQAEEVDVVLLVPV